MLSWLIKNLATHRSNLFANLVLLMMDDDDDEYECPISRLLHFYRFDMTHCAYINCSRDTLVLTVVDQ